MTNNRWILAVSGGPDSMALLHKMAHKGYDCIVAHVNYQKRATSDHDEQLVADFCAHQRLRFESIRYEGLPKGNFQAAARDFRYAFFARLVHQYQAQGVAVAHHQDDELETYLFQKQRKMLSETVGLNEYTVLNQVVVWRPLLDQTKQELLRYCQEHALDYALDESNQQLLYERNRIRQQLACLSADETAAIRHEMITAKKRWQALRQRIDETVAGWGECLSWHHYLGIETTVRPLALRAWFKKYGVDVSTMSGDHLQEIDRQIQSGTLDMAVGSRTLTVSYQEMCLQGDPSFAYVLADVTPIETEHFALRPSGRVIEGLTLRPDDFPITIRNATESDAIVMRFGTKKLNRFFIDRKIPLHRRRQWLVVENKVGEIVFVAGLGCDIWHFSNIPTVFVVELSLSQEDFGKMHQDVKKILLTEKEIEDKCRELGHELTQYYKQNATTPILIALLKGSVPFLAQLIQFIELDIEYDFMDVSSYEGTESARDVRILKDLDRSIKGESILLVEDIVDTGHTIKSIKQLLYNKGAEDVKIVSLLDKPSRREVDVSADFVGFEIPNEFVIGFGLDFNEKYRQLPYIGVLKDECYMIEE